MNAVYNNSFTKALALEGESLIKLNPVAVLVVSAHWLTNGTHVSVSPNPPTIHDFSGFSDELFPGPVSGSRCPRTLLSILRI